MAVLALDQWVGEAVQMAAGAPGLRVHKNSGVEAHHVIAAPDKCLPPGIFDVALHLHAQRAVVPRACQSAVNFTALKYESPAFAEGYNRLYVHLSFALNHVNLDCACVSVYLPGAVNNSEHPRKYDSIV
jgi:hypothetical protein